MFRAYSVAPLVAAGLVTAACATDSTPTSSNLIGGHVQQLRPNGLEDLVVKIQVA